MKEIDVKIMMPEGLHLRPAMQISDLANQFSCEIIIKNGETMVNGKSIMEVMTLMVPSGGTIRIEACGDDAVAALEALRRLIEVTLVAEAGGA